MMKRTFTDTVSTACDCDERASLIAFVDQFAATMKHELLNKLEQGYQGWDCDEYETDIHAKLYNRIMIQDWSKEDMVAVANFAAMLWNFKLPKV